MVINDTNSFEIMFLGAANDVHTVRWVNELAKKGLEVHLVYCKNQCPKNDVIDMRVKQYSLKFSSPIGYYLNALEVKKIFNTVKPSIVNGHYASGYGTLLRLSNCHPSILSVWGSDVFEFPYRNKYSMKLIKKNLEFPLAISSTSHIMAEQITRLSKWHLSEIEVIPFGVDLDLFKRNKRYTTNKKIKIGIAKKLKKNYGIDNVIKAFNIANKKMQQIFLDVEISLDIYGEGPQKQELKELISSLKLDSQIKLKGYVPNSELPNIMEHFDICILGSEMESFGVSAVEALAMGIPLIATDTDGFKEVLNNGEFGVIVSKGDIEKMADAILHLIHNKQMRENYSKVGRPHVKDKYNWNKNVDSMIALYKNTIKYYYSN